jgi:hypothetical protein
MKNPNRSLAFVLSLAFLPLACGDELDDTVEDANLLADIDSGKFNIQFVRVEGGIIMSEVGPTDVPSPLTYLVKEHQASPLEIFMAVAPNEEAPEELVVAHERKVDAPPRQLSVDDSSFRGFSGGVSGATCTSFADGLWLAGQGWANTELDTPTLTETNYWHDTGAHTTVDFMSHVCNVSESGNSIGLVHQVIYDSTVQFNRTGIDPNERSTIIGDFSVSESWHASVVGPGYPDGQTNSVRISFNW